MRKIFALVLALVLLAGCAAPAVTQEETTNEQTTTGVTTTTAMTAEPHYHLLRQPNFVVHRKLIGRY